MYKLLIRPLLFLFDPESVHHFTFRFLKTASAVPGVGALFTFIFSSNDQRLSKTLFGITFPGPVGLAAGFDKDARLIGPLHSLGFGFIEIGTLTPRPQPGNPRPRLFRLPADKAIVNRMGFNNEGVLAAAERLKKRKAGIIIGGNIGKNKATPNEQAIDDYRICFDALEPYVDYFVVNVSSPNTPGLRELQEKEPLEKLLAAIKALSQSKPKPKPVLLKIAPDLTQTQLDDIVSILGSTKTDGVIATNTTISREGLVASKQSLEKIGNGGVSGAPLASRSNEVIQYLRSKLGKDYPIIGVGGIMSPQDALDKLNAGADLVQVYTGFIYEGPGFVKRINRYLLDRLG
jgi:dihydroorotate dehydrogenase